MIKETSKGLALSPEKKRGSKEIEEKLEDWNLRPEGMRLSQESCHPLP